jgi:hypothetical protein
MFNQQTYPQSRMRLIILDDSPDGIQDPLLVEQMAQQANVQYVRHLGAKMTIGAKRNRLNELALQAGADVIVNMDDDDFYPDVRVEHAVDALKKSGCQIAGSSIMHIMFLANNEIRRFGPYGARPGAKFGYGANTNHATAGTFAYTRQYLADGHHFDETVHTGEESSFTSAFGQPMVQLDSQKAILCISHLRNTFEKAQIRLTGVPTILKLRDFVRDPKLREFYQGLVDAQRCDPPPPAAAAEAVAAPAAETTGGEVVVTVDKPEPEPEAEAEADADADADFVLVGTPPSTPVSVVATEADAAATAEEEPLPAV